jgi:hypothetical protein
VKNTDPFSPITLATETLTLPECASAALDLIAAVLDEIEEAIANPSYSDEELLACLSDRGVLRNRFSALCAYREDY